MGKIGLTNWGIALGGYATVFVVLAIIMLVLVVMKLVFGRQSAAKDETKTASAAVPTPAPAQVSNNIDLSTIDKEEIVAVTAAALAAADQENNSKCQVRIMSVKQL